MDKALHFPSEGLRLEGRIRQGGDKGVVLCHPHPLYGGNMDNNVVQAGALAFQSNGWTTLRFNFRGVGSSEGLPGEGQREVQDVTAALQYLRESHGIAVDRMMLLGYSFGARVGLLALQDYDPLFGWVAIAPPLGIWDFSFAIEIAGRKMVIAGDQDLFCPLPDLNSFFQSLPDPKERIIFPETDHFFWGRERALSDTIERTLSVWASDL